MQALFSLERMLRGLVGDGVAASAVVTKVFIPNFDTSGILACLSPNADCAKLLL